MDVVRADRLKILAAAALFSTGGAAIKACTLTAWQVAGFRAGVAALAVLVLAPESRRGWTRKTFVVGAAYAATVTLFAIANKLTTSANTIFLQSTAPLYLLLLGPWLLHEPIRRRDLAFLAALVVGMALFFVGVEPARATATDPLLGNLLALGSGVAWAFTVAGIRWLGRDAAATGNAAAAATVAGNAMAFLLAMPFALPVAESRPLDWALISFLGVFQIALAYVLLTRSVKSVTALEAVLLLLLEPVLNPIWAWVVHGETPGTWSLAGAVVILAATAANAFSGARRGRRAGDRPGSAR